MSVSKTMTLNFALVLRTSVLVGWRFRNGSVWTMAILIVQLSFTFSEILTKPINTVSVVGHKTKMECSRNLFYVYLPVQWEFVPARFDLTGNPMTLYIAERRRKKAWYKMHTVDKARHDIVVDAVGLSHAGTYTCTIGSSRASAQLIVLASDPVCETDVRASKGTTVEGDYIQMWCTVEYNGNWDPVFTRNESFGRTDEEASGMSMSKTSATVSPTIRIKSTASDNGVTISWKTRFDPPSTVSSMQLPGQSVATNAPHYQHIWNFKANVLYSVRNLTILTSSRIYELHVGDSLICSADGNPSPTFQWTEAGTTRVIDGQILAVDQTMPLMHNLIFKCTATNTVAGERKEISDIVAFTVAGNSVDRSSTHETPKDDSGLDAIDESNAQTGESIANEGYAYLKHSSSTLPAAYTQLELRRQLGNLSQNPHEG